MAKKKKATKKAAKKSAKKVTKKKVIAKKTAKKAAKKSAPKPVKKPAKAAKAAPAGAATLVGKSAPAFTMPTGDGQSISLSDFRGQRVLLYFYPKDDTPGCTAQACALRDGMETLTSANTVVIGVSKDSVGSHQKFKTKYDLNFLLASDENTGVSEKYGVWVEKNMYGRKYMGIQRSTFLIDEKGVVRKEWRGVSVPTHYDDVRAALAEL
jgi:peroxiredoxin Q/BCP